jgi:RNA polymerase sigma-70 factor, ECF subfamily
MTQLVGRFERPLFRFILQMVGDAHLAEDLFQETFLRLHRARASYKAQQPLKPYLYRIAINVVNDARARGATKLKTTSLDQPAGTQPGAGPVINTVNSGAPEPSDRLQHRETERKVRDAVDALPDTEREVVVLRMFQGLSFSEIAQITEVPVPTAKSRMLYALRRLKPVLETYLGRDAAAAPVPLANPRDGALKKDLWL